MNRGFVPDRSADPIAIAKSPAAHACANCGASAPERYCPACGQDTRDRLPTFVQFMREATGRYLAFDGKFWTTLVPLLFRPGFLTRAYLAGKRKRFIGPARLFLISSLVLFAVLRFEAQSAQIMRLDDVIKSDVGASEKSTKPGAKSGTKDSEPDLLDIDNDLRVSVNGLPESVDGALRSRIDHFNRLPREQKVEQIIAGTTRYGPYAMFVLLPAFAALLKAAYPGRRRYPGRPRLYGEHLVFAAHNHAFVFISGALLFTVPVALVRQLIAVWTIAYLVWSMRAVYGGSWLGIAVRAFVLAAAYFVLFAIANIGLLVAAVLLR